MTAGRTPSRAPGPVASAIVLVVALVVCAWFALAIRAFHDEGQVSALLSPSHRLGEAGARTIQARLNDAAVLNPDINVDAFRVTLYAKTGRRRQAIALANELTRREPMNVTTWSLLSYLAIAASDRAAYDRAQAHMRVLVPPVAQ